MSTVNLPRASAEDEHNAPDPSIPATPKRNAFTELMAPKPKPGPTTSQSPPKHLASSFPYSPNNPRHGLAPYITAPGSYSASHFSRVISYTPDFVLIEDAFPKATIHLLLLPRDPAKTLLDPREALSSDPAFLATVRKEAEAAKLLAAKELRRVLGKHSVTEQTRTAALAASADPDDATQPDLPPARDYTASITAGIHAHPSMAHLHIHIISADMHSATMRHRKHYNSFNTPFLVPLDAFPLAPDDPRRQVSVQNANLRRDFVCWRCGAGFGNSFVKLKTHLELEFQEWKAA